MMPSNDTLRDNFYAALVWEILILSTESSIWVLCQSANLETAKLGWLTMLEKYNLLSSMWLVKAVKIYSRILCSFCIYLLFYGHVLVSSYYEFLSPWCDLPVTFWLLGVSSLDLHIFNLASTDLGESLMTMICLEYMFIDVAYCYY